MKLIFPHISRLFSARPVQALGKLTLWLLLMALVCSNLLLSLSGGPTLTHVFVRPFSAATHMDLAQLLWKNGLRNQATTELLLATDLLQGSKNVLGVQTDPEKLLNDWKSEPQRLARTLASWQQLVSEHPDYRDGYIQIAYTAYTLGKQNEAIAALTRAQELDPNNATIDKLLSFLK